MVGTNTTRRQFLLAGLAAGLPLLAACGSPAATPTAPTAQPSPRPTGLATAVATQFAPTPTTAPKAATQATAQQPVTLTLWDWAPQRVDVEKPFFNTKYAGNVTSKVKGVDFTVIGWGDYWTKLLAAIPAGQGPDMYQFHNTKHTDYISAGLLAPYPPDILDYAKDWDGVQQRHFTYIPDGKVYYLPLGTMAAALYVNDELWNEAGLTDADAPKTWDQLIPIAKKLTKLSPKGEVLQAGFGFNSGGWLIWNDMMYQQGQWQYDETGKKILVDTPASRTALEFLLNLINKHHVNSASFLSVAEGFGAKKIAMTYSWLYFTGYLRTSLKSLKFRILPLPTFSGKLLPAYGRNNYEVLIAVNPKAPGGHQDLAWPLLDWFYHQDDALVTLALLLNVIPAKPSLHSDQRIQADPGSKVLVEALPYTVFPGEFPALLIGAYGRYIDQGYLQGKMPLDTMIKQLVQEGDKIMSEKSYWIIERNYAHAAAFKSG